MFFKETLKKLLKPKTEPAQKAKIHSLDNVPLLTEDTVMADGYSWIPDWKEILGEDWPKWQEIAAAKHDGPKILLATSIGGNSALTPMETLFAIALTLRGAEVHFLLCDKSLPACQNCSTKETKDQQQLLDNGPAACNWCFETGKNALEQLGLPVHYYSTWIEEEDRKEASEIAAGVNLDNIFSITDCGIELEEIVKSAALRYFARGDFAGEELALPVLRKYLESAILTNRCLSRLYEKYSYEMTVSNQGLYIPQGNVVAIGDKYGSRVVTWDIAYRVGCIHISHKKTHIRSFLEEPMENWVDMEWNDRTVKEIQDYLTSRWSGQFDWLKIVTEGSDTIPEDIAKEIGIDLSKPVIGLLTNVIWDEQLCYPANAFENQLDWLMRTIEYFSTREDLQLIVRVHPAETNCWLKSRQLAIDEIKKNFTSIPDNVFLIPPDSTINTYKTMMLCDSVLIYGTTAGLELSCMKIPVIVAGEAWIRGKGISIDVSSPEQYKSILDSLPLNRALEQEKYERALKYAYHYYLRKMIPINLVEPTGFENSPYRIKKQPLASFSEGSDAGLDLFCKGLLEGSEFIYPAELLHNNPA